MGVFSVSVSEITNYDGLFQIVPPEGINNLGINVHYGEPFLLKTIEVNTICFIIAKSPVYYMNKEDVVGFQ